MLKKILTLALLLLAFGTWSFHAYAKETKTVTALVNSPNLQELIIQVPKGTSKDESAIRQAMFAAGGVQYRGYCSKLQIYFFLVDRNIHGDDSFVENVFHPLNLAYEIKIGSSINDVRAACNMDLLPAEQNQIGQ